MESLTVPARLPCLLLGNAVLLPTAFAKITLSERGHRTPALLEYLSASDRPDAYVAIVPEVMKDDAQDDDSGGLRSVPLNKAGTIATAARVLQLSRIVQSGDWVLLLEGVARVMVDQVLPAAQLEGGYDSVEVTQLELRPHGSGQPFLKHPLPITGSTAPAGHGSASGVASTSYGSTSSGLDHGGGAEGNLQELGKQLKAVTRQLLRQLSRTLGGAQPTRRVMELLDTVPAWRAADVVAAALSASYQERLAVLRAVDHKQRIKLALSIAEKALDALRGAGPSGSSTGLASWPRQGGKGGRTQGVLSELSGRDSVPGGAEDDDPDGLDALMARLTAAHPPPEVAKAAAKEYRRLRQSGENQPGYAAARAYLETLADLPWSRTAADLAAEEQRSHTATPTSAAVASSSQPGAKAADSKHQGGQRLNSHTPTGHAANSSSSQGTGAAAGKGLSSSGAQQMSVKQGLQGSAAASDAAHAPMGVPLSLKSARVLLDGQHYGLDKIKDRVIEYLAVLRLKGSSARAPILCFIGPPGVGKTSLARSVAEVLGRPFVRIALGGVRDEAEVRGHRRTYVGAMPGRLVAGLRRAHCCDPVMLLDELDKLGKDSLRGDPSAALLEVLDPEQNSAFVDAYLGLPVDLSRVTFVATANRAADIPAPLLDRLEVVTLSGYTLEEKVHIGRVHLVPKALQDHGLDARHVHFPDSVLEFITERYTREAGVRALSRSLAAICRHVAVSIVSEHEALAAPASSNAHQQSAWPSHGPPSLQQVALRSAVGEWPVPAAAARCQAGHATAGASMAAGVQAAAQSMAMVPHSSQGLGCSPAADQEASSSLGTLAATAHPPPEDAARALGSMLRDSTSLAGLSEAPLDQLWGGVAHATSTSHSGHRHQKSTGAASAPVKPGFVSRVLGSAAGRQQSVSIAPPAAPPASGTSNSSWLFPWGSSSSSKGSHTAAAEVRREGSQAHRMDAARSAGAGPGPHGLSQPMVQYVGMPQALPYPPDLLQQHDAMTVTEELVETVLGPPRFDGAGEGVEAVALPGAAAGLVWTSVGGSVQYIECARISYGTPGRSGTLTLTGQVGEVLEESARIALSWIRAHAADLGLADSMHTAHMQQPLLPAPAGVEQPGGADLLGPVTPWPKSHHRRPAQHTPPCTQDHHLASTAVCHSNNTAHCRDTACEVADDAAQQPAGSEGGPVTVTSSLALPTSSSSPALCWDVHVHLPAGAIPKDGPSAGITLAVALLSLLSGRVVRADTAMTGELTLRGLVLPVGGVKEKLLAARHAGLRRVLVPARNMRDVMAEVPQAVRASLTIIPVERLEQVLAAAFDPPFVLRPPPALNAKL